MVASCAPRAVIAGSASTRRAVTARTTAVATPRGGGRASATWTTAFGQAELESAVLSTIKTFLLDPDARATGVRAELERLSAERERLTADLVTIDRHVATVDHKLEALLD